MVRWVSVPTCVTPAGRSPRRPTPQARGGRGGGRVSGPGARSCTHTDARHPGWAVPTEADPAGERRRGRRPVSGPGARACARRLAGRSPRRPNLQAGGGRGGGRSVCWAHHLVEPGQRVSDPILARVTGSGPAGRCPRRLSLQAGGSRGGGRSACWAHPLVEPGQRVSDPILARVTGWAVPTEAEPAGGRRQGRRPVGVLGPPSGGAGSAGQ